MVDVSRTRHPGRIETQFGCLSSPYSSGIPVTPADSFSQRINSAMTPHSWVQSHCVPSSMNMTDSCNSGQGEVLFQGLLSPQDHYYDIALPSGLPFLDDENLCQDEISKKGMRESRQLQIDDAFMHPQSFESIYDSQHQSLNACFSQSIFESNQDYSGMPGSSLFNSTMVTDHQSASETVVPAQTFAEPVTPMSHHSERSFDNWTLGSPSPTSSSGSFSTIMTPCYSTDVSRRSSIDTSEEPLTPSIDGEMKFSKCPSIRVNRVTKAKSECSKGTTKIKMEPDMDAPYTVIEKGKDIHRCMIDGCESRDKSFRRPEHLKRHMRKHTGEDVHKCPLCDKTIKRNDNLKAHVKRHITGARTTKKEPEARRLLEKMELKKKEKKGVTKTDRRRRHGSLDL
ncbi:MAG: hypothetical protein M1834_000174 [Cirrosporium novae-zelandiae]|nr:MAG: hypothetical protein M1834_000174 [Cirrosporium novae-zelandiae]